MKNKESLLYVSLEGTQRENLIGLSRVVSKNNAIVYDSFESLFNAIDKMLETNQKIVLAIDEYPYLAESYPLFFLLFKSILIYAGKIKICF